MSSIIVAMVLLALLLFTFIAMFITSSNTQNINTLDDEFDQLSSVVNGSGFVTESGDNVFTASNTFTSGTTFNSSIVLSSANIKPIKEWVTWGYGGTNSTTYFVNTSSSNITVSEASTGAYNVRIANMTGIIGFASVSGSPFNTQIYGSGGSYQVYLQNKDGSPTVNNNIQMSFFII